MRLRRFCLLILFVLCLTSCEETNVSLIVDAASDAVTAITLTDEQVQQFSSQAAVVADSKHRVAGTNSAYHTRLRRLTQRYSEWDGHTFNYKVYQTKNVNAFAMADGTVRVNSGLMDLMNDQELLFVIGHEIGHVVHEHTRKQVVLAYASSALRKGLASQNNEIGQIAGSVVGAFAEKLTHAQYSQYEEREADQYGLAFLQKQRLGKESAISALRKLASLGGRHTILSSHPEPEARVQDLLEHQKTNNAEEPGFIVQALKMGLDLLNWLMELIKSFIR